MGAIKQNEHDLLSCRQRNGDRWSLPSAIPQAETRTNGVLADTVVAVGARVRQERKQLAQKLQLTETQVRWRSANTTAARRRFVPKFMPLVVRVRVPVPRCNPKLRPLLTQLI